MRLGVDVGSVRVGLAACDSSGVLAVPVRTLARDWSVGNPTTGRDDVGDDVLVIAAEVLERDAVEVVVGLPRSMSGGEGPAAEAARRYAVLIARRVAPVPVRLVDERLSSAGAHRALYDSGVRGRRHRSVVDQAAAVLFLQTALDAERSSGEPPGSIVDPEPGPQGVEAT